MKSYKWDWFRKFSKLRYCKTHKTITPWWRRCCKPIIFLLIPILFGCAQTQQFTLDASKQNLENAKISRQVAQETMSTWSLNSGLIACGTEDVISQLTMKDIQRMDKLTKDSGKWSDEDYRSGCFLGIGMKLSAKQIQAFIQQMISLVGQSFGK